MYKILLACGAGCSSGLVAQRMRKYAKRNNIEAQIRAVGDAEIINCVEDYDILMLGPHLLKDVVRVLDEATEI